MANTGTGDVTSGDEDGEDDKRITLLDILEERNRAANRKGLIHSMAIISKLKHTKYAEIADKFDKLFHEVQEQNLVEGATGLLLFYPWHCVHIVEGGLEILLACVKELRRDQMSSTAGNFVNSKIVVISHNIPARLYPAWSYTVQDIQAPNIDGYEPPESIEKVVADMAVQMVRLGAYISKQPKNYLKTTLDSLHEKVSELLPQQGLVNYLLRTNVPCLRLPEEYLTIYEQPYDVHLAADFVWPLPLRNLPYN